MSRFSNWFYIYSAVILPVTNVLLFLGILGAILSLFVFCHHKFRHISINILFFFLSLFHLVLLVFAFPIITFGPLSTFFVYFMKVRNVCTVYIYPYTAIAHTLSVWLLILISFERWAAVCRPLLINTYCTCRRAIASSLLLIFLACVYNQGRFFEFSLTDNLNVEMKLRTNQYYMLWFESVGTIVFIYTIPLVSVGTFNTLIIRQMRKSSAARRTMTQNQQNEHKTAQLLVYMVVLFVICYTMSLVLNVIETIDYELFGTEVGYALTDFNNLLVVLNAASSPLLYFCFSTRYRACAKLIVAKACRSQAYLTALLQSDTLVASLNNTNGRSESQVIMVSCRSIEGRNTPSLDSHRPRSETSPGHLASCHLTLGGTMSESLDRQGPKRGSSSSERSVMFKLLEENEGTVVTGM